VKQNYIGDNTVYVARVKEGKHGPMFDWSWGYYSVFDADAILYDIFKCGEPYSYYCNPALDDLILQGRSTLDQKKRAEIYAKAQKLLFDDAAYVFKWGLRGVWGVSNRVEYQAPPDEVDRMFLVTPKKK
jgi:peptide/nickel transport system substrate-binding protein